jgi:hypothetical protein
MFLIIKLIINVIFIKPFNLNHPFISFFYFNLYKSPILLLNLKFFNFILLLFPPNHHQKIRFLYFNFNLLFSLLIIYSNISFHH